VGAGRVDRVAQLPHGGLVRPIEALEGQRLDAQLGELVTQAREQLGVPVPLVDGSLEQPGAGRTSAVPQDEGDTGHGSLRWRATAAGWGLRRGRVLRV